MITRLAQLAASPRVRLVQAILKRLPGVSFETRLQFDALPRPHYAYITHNSARLAKRLGHERMTAIEFGCSGGNGLVALQAHCNEVGQATKIGIQTMGFDRGEAGMPAPQGVKDGSAVWQEGFYPMEDPEALRARVPDARIVLGDIAETLPTAFPDEAFTRPDSKRLGPIGAIILDVDYHSSSCEALKIFDILKPEQILPRVFLYADDLVHGDPIAGINDHMGVGLAIREFNEEHVTKKILPDRSLDVPRKVRSSWTSRIFVYHDFSHPQYGAFVGTPGDSRPLR